MSKAQFGVLWGLNACTTALRCKYHRCKLCCE